MELTWAVVWRLLPARRSSTGPSVQPAVFRIGKPDGFPPGTRIARPAEQICIVSDDAGIAAISADCTHLGCTAGMAGTGFSCPRSASSQLQTPEPPPWYRVSLAPGGEIEVDTNTRVEPGKYLKV